MPRVVDYPDVLKTLTELGLVSLYHNSGAFGFPDGTPTGSVGWILREDPTIRPAARALARLVSPPTGKAVAELAATFWAERLADQAVWVMPLSHWAYELEFGNVHWLPALLRRLQILPATLSGRNDGSAIEFTPTERGDFELMIDVMVTCMKQSDFMFAFTGGSTICTVHHHQQLWWTSTDAAIVDRLRELAE